MQVKNEKTYRYLRCLQGDGMWWSWHAHWTLCTSWHSKCPRESRIGLFRRLNKFRREELELGFLRNKITKFFGRPDRHVVHSIIMTVFYCLLEVTGHLFPHQAFCRWESITGNYQKLYSSDECQISCRQCKKNFRSAKSGSLTIILKIAHIESTVFLVTIINRKNCLSVTEQQQKLQNQLVFKLACWSASAFYRLHLFHRTIICFCQLPS
jgi:hypothetical protein